MITMKYDILLRRIQSLAIAACLLMLVPGCGDTSQDQAGAGGEEAAAVIQVADDTGRVFSFDAPPERIAACSAFSLEILMALGHTPVARFDAANLYPPEAESIPTIGRTHSVGPNVEQLIAARPDLIVLHKVFEEFAPAVEQSVGVPVMVMRIDSVQGVREKLALFGELTGKAEEAQQLIDELDQERAVLEDHSEAKKPVALSLLGNDDAWYAHRENHFMGSLLDTAGAVNAAATDESHAKHRALAPIDLEQIIVKDPDVIFLIPYGDADHEVVVKRFTDHPATKSLRAVREGRLHILPDTIYTRQPGPRTGEALKNVIAYLYPDSKSASAEE